MEPKICDIAAPYVMGMSHHQMAEQVGEFGLIGLTPTPIGSQMNALNPHVPHVALSTLAIDEVSFSLKLRGQAPRPIKRQDGVDRIDPVFDLHLLGGGGRPDGNTILIGSPTARQLDLGQTGHTIVAPINQRPALRVIEDRGQIFFSHVHGVVILPSSAYEDSSFCSYSAATCAADCWF